ncbi:phosphoribosylformylglycinamidine cyclo-ligase [Helicobacter mustelae]|uniref:Phosphoribosylformylglycinamidine cyclo-ligase n=1 Tax=Helicobacter mustelae (strain ATCC 43772 / CCUG 25715 / CIP 103759 / LMG 18044 / NCTC 12198 / R85-136P) TaxID=679897 RepID=D3UJ38_HELM1|nr:phosphoribosylformylglycinamidine cyclo-ligase [Helicobacter mustelae]CBG40513.1 phosphoribosylformylglycinamidine cyclo-ligase [Helicobacter mustelae 12198]SQH72011.1 phosphoribosylformylglycinamidine cyclo-ligase [Helicobacter mustelae]STP13154.1 phosphoribosylformylglycinamidine cyclo-ligase [Helicobacter mustelae]
MAISYRDSGVNIDEGNAFVERIKGEVKKTFDANVVGNIGSFSGAYALPSGYQEPVMLAATDGVGTKLKLAIESGRVEGVGVDLVAMCVNDLICNFGTPAFFLDYYATGKLDKMEASKVLRGIVRGCQEAECALIGGETAEMPGMYQGKDFDLAGFAVGIAEKRDLNKNLTIQKNDILVALPSSGLHSNGYSLVRKILFEVLGKKFEDEIAGRALIDVLLEPTRIYVKTYKKIANSIRGLAHITGGGILENIPRILPQGLGGEIDKNAIQTPKIFELISSVMDEQEIYRVLNMGVGMVLVVAPKHLDFVLGHTDGYVIGQVVDSSEGINLR